MMIMNLILYALPCFACAWALSWYQLEGRPAPNFVRITACALLVCVVLHGSTQANVQSGGIASLLGGAVGILMPMLRRWNRLTWRCLTQIGNRRHQ
jgi:hypothetical protein